jgi:phosphatidylserine decarboxylase
MGCEIVFLNILPLQLEVVRSNLLFQIVEGVAIGALLLVPLSLKWEIKQRAALIGALVFGICAGLIGYFIEHIVADSILGHLAIKAVIIALLSFVSSTLMFYRDPERIVPTGMGEIVSPADGTVLYVKRIKKGRVPLSIKKGRSFKIGELAGTKVLDQSIYLVGIGMNLLNVHVNRAPIEGVVKLTHPVRGSFLSLKKDDAILLNERRTTVIDNGVLSVGVIQIASRLVRQIESYVCEGQVVAKGERIGIIHFGSQVDLVLPVITGLEVPVRPGDQVKAGETVIAKVEIVSNAHVIRGKNASVASVKDLEHINTEYMDVEHAA